MPCDALLLRGSCVVNEAMLTGESVPQLKESVRSADCSDPESLIEVSQDTVVDSGWRRHVLLAGTEMLQHTETSQTEQAGSDGSETSASEMKYPRPPDKGCVAFVIRTAFGTSQGGLVRKIMFATERVTANSTETFFFIALLLAFALVASAVVLRAGLLDECRNKFKLVLHCVMIVTSVVPPELPMELSLAVTNSLQALARELVYCTEPFRIPYAGKVTYLCFDKTGTLTQDRMFLSGVISAPLPLPLPLPLPSSEGAGGLDTNGSKDGKAAIDAVGSGGGPVDLPIEEPEDCYDVILAAMSSCHNLFQSGGKLIGEHLANSNDIMRFVC